ncbi:hypothetical protein B566_EDAN013244 [Ephemera danica]|nr:hypothetical protein B566_EDAN013244 [Ephemera danica]
MSAGMPELGSKISLISKADIRYEGRLFTVDPQECTIALSNVRSFGTEDRDASFPVAPQSQIYDYILFRGSDIKDIRVVHNVNPIPNDPAIVTAQQQQQSQANQAAAPGAFTHGLSHSQFGSYSSMGGMPGGLSLGGMGRVTQEARALSSELADLGASSIEQPPPLPHPAQQQQHPMHQKPPMQAAEHSDLISGRSSSTTSPPRKSPTMDQGTQAGTPGAVGSTPPRQRGRGGGQPIGREREQQQQQQQYDQRGEQREQRPNHRNRQQGGTSGGGGAAWQHRDPQMRQHQQPQQQHQQQQHQHQQQQQQHDGWGPQNNRGGNFQQRPPGLMSLSQSVNRGPQQGGQQQNQQQQQQGGGQKKNVLKFEGDYDFEQANTEFETLRTQLANIKLTATAAVSAPKVNGDDKKEVDSGNETAAGDVDGDDDGEIYYDKAKCSQRTDWRHERKLNSETFGVASARRGYRGRGGYYRGGMYRGGSGYRGGYRGNRGGYNRHSGQQQQQPGGMMGGGPQQPGNRPTAAAGGRTIHQ